MSDVRIDVDGVFRMVVTFADVAGELATVAAGLASAGADPALTADGGRPGLASHLDEISDRIEGLAGAYRHDGIEMQHIAGAARAADATNVLVSPPLMTGASFPQVPGVDIGAVFDRAVDRVADVAEVAGPPLRRRWNALVEHNMQAAMSSALLATAVGYEGLQLAFDPGGRVTDLVAGGDRGSASGDLGGTFTSRAVPGYEAERSSSPVQRGRGAIIQFLDATGDDNRIHDDEFQLVSHGNDHYTVVLPGVTDLADPTVGLDPRTRSVRDLDTYSIRSAFSADVADNHYAVMVDEALRVAGVPHGAKLLLVGHSFGSDTALDLAASPQFNGRHYDVTHVVAAAYHSQPQLPHVQADTEVLVLQNTRDLAVLVESLSDRLTFDEPRAAAHPQGSEIVVRAFDGGWSRLGHHQDHYTGYLAAVEDGPVEQFFHSVDRAGYSQGGSARSIDVSVPGPNDRPSSTAPNSARSV